MRCQAPLLSTLVMLLGACQAAPQLPEGLDRLEAARSAFAVGDDQTAAAFAEGVAGDEALSPGERGEAAFVAAEAEMRRGEHLDAYRHYRSILENAPFSEHVGIIEGRLFEIGTAFFEEEKYDGWIFDEHARGVGVMETLRTHYRKSDLADDALKAIADYLASPEVGDWEEASLRYQELFEQHPESEWAEDARWRAGHCLLKQSQGPAYDRTELLRAQDFFEESLRLYPKGVAIQRVREDLWTVRNLLASYEVQVADFYQRRNQPQGERIRLVNAALLYPETNAGAQAALRLKEYGIDLEILDREAILSNPRLQSVDNIQAGARLFGGRRGGLGWEW